MEHSHLVEAQAIHLFPDFDDLCQLFLKVDCKRGCGVCWGSRHGEQPIKNTLLHLRSHLNLAQRMSESSLL